MKVYCKKDWFIDFNEYIKQHCPNYESRPNDIEFEKGKYYNAFESKKSIGIWLADNSDYLQFDYETGHFNEYFVTEEQHNRNLKLQKLNLVKSK